MVNALPMQAQHKGSTNSVCNGRVEAHEPRHQYNRDFENKYNKNLLRTKQDTLYNRLLNKQVTPTKQSAPYSTKINDDIDHIVLEYLAMSRKLQCLEPFHLGLRTSQVIFNVLIQTYSYNLGNNCYHDYLMCAMALKQP